MFVFLHHLLCKTHAESARRQFLIAKFTYAIGIPTKNICELNCNYFNHCTYMRWSLIPCCVFMKDFFFNDKNDIMLLTFFWVTIWYKYHDFILDFLKALIWIRITKIRIIPTKVLANEDIINLNLCGKKKSFLEALLSTPLPPPLK